MAKGSLEIAHCLLQFGCLAAGGTNFIERMNEAVPVALFDRRAFLVEFNRRLEIRQGPLKVSKAKRLKMVDALAAKLQLRRDPLNDEVKNFADAPDPDNIAFP